MKFWLYSLASIATLTSSASQAGVGNEFSYLGLGAQYNTFEELNFTPDLVEGGYQPLTFADDTSGLASRFFYGRHFGQYLALEAGANFMSAPSFTLKNGEATVHKGKFTSFGLDLKAFATLPITDSQFIRAHLGAMLWDNDFEFVSGPSGTTSLSKSSDTNVSTLYGLGYGYAFNKRNALVLEYESTEIADVSLNNVSLSFLIKL